MAVARAVRIFQSRSLADHLLLSRVVPTFCKSTTKNSYTTSAEESTIEEKVEETIEEDDLEALRNISRLPKKYRDRMLHVMTPIPKDVNPDFFTEIHQAASFKRQLYAKYGRKSGLNPGILWPSEDELQEMLEFENEWEPTLQQRWKKLEDGKRLEMKERKEKEQYIDKQLSKMPQVIKDYRNRLQKLEDQEKQKHVKKKALLDEARDFYGYSIDANDPRFEQMKLAKEEEEKKLKKKKKMEEKMAKLQGGKGN